MHFITRITLGRLPVRPERELDSRGQRTPDLSRAPGATGGANGVKTAFLTLWIVTTLAAVVACTPASDSDDESAGSVTYGAPRDLPTMTEDAATAGAEFLATRLEQIGTAVEEVAAVSAAASPIAAAATPEPFRLAFSGDTSDAGDGEISARNQQVLRALASDLKIDGPSDPGLLMAALIPGVSDPERQRETIPTPTPGVVPVAVQDDDENAGDTDRDGPSGTAVVVSEHLEQEDATGGDEPALPAPPAVEDSSKDRLPGSTPVDDVPAPTGGGVVEEDLSGPGQSPQGGVPHGDSSGPEDAPGKSGASHGAATVGENDGDSDAAGKNGSPGAAATSDDHRKVSDDLAGPDDPPDSTGKSHASGNSFPGDETDVSRNGSGGGPGHANDAKSRRVGS